MSSTPTTLPRAVRRHVPAGPSSSSRAHRKAGLADNPPTPQLPQSPQLLQRAPEPATRPPAQGDQARPITQRAFSCRCGRPVFFRNSECLACHTPLGYDPDLQGLMPLEPVGEGADAVLLWHAIGSPSTTRLYRRCGNLNSAAACNWLVPAAADDPSVKALLCRCCRLTRTTPDLSVPEHSVWWNHIELAKRRLVSSLIGLGLPVQSKQSEDPQRGMVFDLLRAEPGGAPVVTGHADGVITIDVEEAVDTWREQRRTALGEPYRTLLGHLRHETGHYYWQRLVEGTHWHTAWRDAFGDEQQDYAAALKRHYVQGPPSDWGSRFVSPYASSHPWEDWAETWAHYLHLVDTLDTARSFGLDGERVELSYERFAPSQVSDSNEPLVRDFVQLINSWMELTGVLNELSRSMDVPDFYPFMLSTPAVRKLYFAHRVIAEAGLSKGA